MDGPVQDLPLLPPHGHHIEPQHANIQCTMEKLEELYDFLEGTEFARHPDHRIPIAKLRIIERDLWRKIAIITYGTKALTLVNAIDKILADSFYWTRAFYGYGSPGKGKGSGYNQEYGGQRYQGAYQQWQPREGTPRLSGAKKRKLSFQRGQPREAWTNPKGGKKGEKAERTLTKVTTTKAANQ